MGAITKPRAATIGALSRLTGCNIETIRYYERRGLMPRPPRSLGGHRLYDDGDVRRLRFIRRGRELGFPLPAVRELLGLDESRGTCAQAQALAAAHLAEVRRKISDLRRMERVLARTLSRCRGAGVPGCPLLDALSSEARQ